MGKKKQPARASGSIFESQSRLTAVYSAIREIDSRLQELRRQREEAEQAHREQIRVSLGSSNIEERQAAERIAGFWGVKVDRDRWQKETE